jgi:ABC-type transporter Mla subunit MlaD
MQKLAPVVQQNAEGLIQRVMRARELSETFGKLMETGAEKIAAIESAADEARKARESIGVATRELTRIQKTADHWAESARQLSGRQAEFIASGNAAATRLRTLSDAGERLRDSVREDVVTLRELLRESRLERLAWEKLLARMPAGLAAASGGGEAGGGASGSSGKSAPAALADRVRRLTDFIRHAAEVGEPGSAPESAAPTATWPESAASIATRPEAVLPSRTL